MKKEKEKKFAIDVLQELQKQGKTEGIPGEEFLKVCRTVGQSYGESTSQGSLINLSRIVLKKTTGFVTVKAGARHGKKVNLDVYFFNIPGAIEKLQKKEQAPEFNLQKEEKPKVAKKSKRVQTSCNKSVMDSMIAILVQLSSGPKQLTELNEAIKPSSPIYQTRVDYWVESIKKFSGIDIKITSIHSGGKATLSTPTGWLKGILLRLREFYLKWYGEEPEIPRDLIFPSDKKENEETEEKEKEIETIMDKDFSKFNEEEKLCLYYIDEFIETFPNRISKVVSTTSGLFIYGVKNALGLNDTEVKKIEKLQLPFYILPYEKVKEFIRKKSGVDFNLLINYYPRMIGNESIVVVLKRLNEIEKNVATLLKWKYESKVARKEKEPEIKAQDTKIPEPIVPVQKTIAQKKEDVKKKEEEWKTVYLRYSGKQLTLPSGIKLELELETPETKIWKVMFAGKEAEKALFNLFLSFRGEEKIMDQNLTSKFESLKKTILELVESEI